MTELPITNSSKAMTDKETLLSVLSAFEALEMTAGLPAMRDEPVRVKARKAITSLQALIDKPAADDRLLDRDEAVSIMEEARIDFWWKVIDRCHQIPSINLQAMSYVFDALSANGYQIVRKP